MAVAAIISDFTATVPADLNWGADSAEGLRSAFGVIKQAVMARVQAARDWEAGTDLDSNPVAKLHALFHDEERPAVAANAVWRALPVVHSATTMRSTYTSVWAM
jgi:hypothetical protein